MQFHFSRFLGGLALAAPVLFVSAAPAVQDQPVGVGESIALTRSSLEEMVATKRLIAETKREWSIDQELLADRIEMVQDEIESLRASIADAAKSASDTQTKLEELRAEDKGLEDASAGLAAIVGNLEQRTKELLPRLPAPIAETVRPLSQALPEDPQASKASLTDRFPRLLGILNQVNKFNRDIHPISERVALESGDFAEVTALYLGLGQAFYATADALHAGVGVPNEDGWAWSYADQSAAEIAAAIAIYKKTAGAGFSLVPVTIQ